MLKIGDDEEKKSVGEIEEELVNMDASLASDSGSEIEKSSESGGKI